ncbi:alpha/beta hydrolase [Blastococcus sp. TML/M2B]|uniref:alpha/beta fold hydrolase n=1 Tax=unclassified Blastococcus TaxID=2619396 RepID=UPI001909480E|nr:MULTISPECIES: alpha/beta hydrolase [unclassified Blastococcus]MBN1093394.1 alpha/beta hydrolase [Blastococcus sp. TML/M2B]MBN1096489.1 alpha/beta hydrolase [Blastococcus sp. TML/C7B]
MTSAPTRIVVVPGLGLDERSWAGVRSRLPASLPADVVPLPGMGRRKPVPGLELLAAGLRERLGPGPVVLAGHSQGCQVVAAVAERDPRVAAVVLLGPTTDPRLRRLRGLVPAWLRTAVREPLPEVPRILAQWSRTGPRAMRALWRRASPDRIEARLARIAVPVVVVRGSRDALCPGDWAARLAATATHGRLVELPGAAHMTPQSHPAEVAAVLAGLG